MKSVISELVRRNALLVDRREPVSRLFGFVRGDTETVPVIGDQGYPYGVPNLRGLARQRVNPEEKIGGACATGTKTLSPRSPVSEAVRIVAHNRIPYVPVVEGEQLVGVVFARDLLAHVRSDARARELAHEVPLVPERASVGEALHHLREAAAPLLPVVDASGRFMGVIRLRALLLMEQDARPDGRAYTGGKEHNPNMEPVGGLVGADAPSVDAGAGFDEARERLREHEAVVVLEGGDRPVGVLTPEGVLQRVAPRAPLRL